MTFSRILVPLDGTEVAAGVLPVVRDLAARLRSSVRLLAVVDPGAPELPVFHDESSNSSGATGGTAVPERRSTERFQTHLLAEARAYLKSVAEKLDESGLRVDLEAVTGDPQTEIVVAARRYHADVIAMSTHGRSAIGRGWLGSVTDRVLHSSPIPMLIVRPGDPDVQTATSTPPLQTVIVGLDGSALAETAVDIARRLAAKLDADLLLLRATGAATHAFACADGSMTVGHDLAAELERDAESYLDKVASAQANDGLNVRTVIGSGTPEAELRQVAADSPGALVVLATRGRSGLTRWVLGSVTDRVVRSSQAPVLVVPPVLNG